MGVPKLFAWLTKKYPQIIFDKNLDNIDNFFFDFNGLIHPCAHKILSKYNNSVDKNQLERLIIKHIINYTDFIIDNLNINKLIYIYYLLYLLCVLCKEGITAVVANTAGSDDLLTHHAVPRVDYYNMSKQQCCHSWKNLINAQCTNEFFIVLN